MPTSCRLSARGEIEPETTLTEIVTIEAGENDKADQYEYIADCM